MASHSTQTDTRAKVNYKISSENVPYVWLLDLPTNISWSSKACKKSVWHDVRFHDDFIAAVLHFPLTRFQQKTGYVVRSKNTICINIFC